MTHSVSFFLNGELVKIENPPPDLLLIDYLRSPDVGLTGAKKGCGQGGCGACTVILSSHDAETGRPTHRSINSCLRPVCALDGLSVTTIEGTGGATRPAPEHLAHQLAYSRAAAPATHVTREEAQAARAASRVRDEARTTTARVLGAAAAPGAPTGADDVPPEGMNPVAHRLAMNNGTQCGYCTTGFVMNMCALLENRPRPTKREIQDVFDGNLCRCTGYRPILTGMGTFAADWTTEDEANRMKCLPEEALSALAPAARPKVPLPQVDRQAPRSTRFEAGGRVWVRPTTLEELGEILREHPGERTRMVNGNTSYGVYPDEVRDAEVLIDIRLVPELRGSAVGDRWVDVGASTTYSELIELLDDIRERHCLDENTGIGALWLMARRTAGTIVRNAATLAGNTVLVLDHVRVGEPFPSDLLTALVAVGAEVTVWWARDGGEPRRLPVAELVDRAAADPAPPDGVVILTYHLPLLPAEDVVLAQKVALRDVNAHSLVNATTRLRLAGTEVEDAVVVFGGIAPHPWRPARTEAALRDSELTLAGFPAIAGTLREEVTAELARWHDRMASVDWEGITDEYRVQLAVSFLYKAVVNALLEVAPDSVPETGRSAGTDKWGRWPLSGGVQTYEIQDWKAPVSQPYIKLMAFYQAGGQVRYTHETPVPARTVNAAFVQSRVAPANYHFTLPDSRPVDRAELARHLADTWPGFVELVTHEQVPAEGINFQGMGGDQPLLAVEQVGYVGQAIALVVADTEQEAEAIARHVSRECVAYTELHQWPEEWREPVLGIEDALRLGSVFPDYPKSANFNSHIWRITRPGSDLSWAEDRDPLDRSISRATKSVGGVECTVVAGAQSTGGQAHFYMETQACVVEPLDGDRWRIVPSTQSPMEMHQTAAMALGVEYHRIEVDVPQVGGGFGGKTEQTRFVVGPAVVAANAVNRPVRLVVPRDSDTGMIGKRHAVYGQYQVAIDPETGVLHGMDTSMWADGGAFYDCSFIVTNCMQLRADNAYQVANFQSRIDVCRTTKAPSTAFRAFGDIQGKLVTESAIDDAAFAAGLDPTDVRETNLYRRGDVTPFGQALSYCYQREVWSFLRDKCAYDVRKADVLEFNRLNRWRKRGIAMMPVKYGSGYNLTMLEQATAYVAVYSGDGSVVIHQGGVEIGQGLTTRVEQVASYVLNVPFDLLRVDGPNTGVTPNPTSTGASTGTTYSAEAVKQACEQLRGRLTEFGYRMLEEKGPDWCADAQIDFWNYGRRGWATPVVNPVTGTPG